MKLRALALFIFSTFYVCLTMAQTEPVANVRVRLLHVAFPLVVDGDSLQVTDLDRDGIKNISLSHDESITIDQRKISGQKIWMLKKAGKIVRSTRPFIEIQSLSPKVKIAGVEFPTPLILSPHNATAVDVIVALKIDDYLEGVLAGEMPVSWPIEALKAQAVAARTYTLYQMKEHGNDIYQLDGSVSDQAYAPLAKESQKEKIRQALAETQDLVLFHNNKLFKAFYHSDCGGQTEDPSVIWGKGKMEKTKAIIDAQCAYSPSGKWALDMSLDDLKAKLVLSGLNLNDLKTVKVASRTPSQRADFLAFNDGTADTLVSGNDLRRILGYKKLKSTLFTISQKDDSVVFSGRGNGHGSGLCQWGAKYMAQKGSTVREILSHYYPSAKLSEFHVANR